MSIQFSSNEMQKLHLLRLARTQNVGPISFFHLLRRFGTAEEALNRLPVVSRRSAAASSIPSLEDVKREYDAHMRKGFSLISYYDAEYPAALRTLQDPPPFISAQGRLNLLSRQTFAVVGARNASQAGEKITQDISTALSRKEWCIVSGLARGIDACAHRTALLSGTIAVIAGGLGHIYPPENKRLYQEIAEQGLILSEDPLGQAPHSALFPKRNRLISGLSWGVLIVEASLKSGSLLTAKYAMEQGRSLFAVPGHPLDPRSRGVNRLIKQGVCLVETAEDIFEEYTSSQSRIHLAREESPEDYFAIPENKESSDMELLYQKVYEALTVAPISIADLAQSIGLSALTVRSILVELELEGKIERYPGDAVMLSPLSEAVNL